MRVDEEGAVRIFVEALEDRGDDDIGRRLGVEVGSVLEPRTDASLVRKHPVRTHIECRDVVRRQHGYEARSLWDIGKLSLCLPQEGCLLDRVLKVVDPEE